MARLLTTGFETQKLAATAANDPEGQSLASTGTVTFDTTNPRSGAACGSCAASAGNFITATVTTTLGRTYFMRGAFRFSSVTPSASLFFQRMEDATGPVGTFSLTTGSKIALRNEVASASLGTTANSIVANTWYVFEMKLLVPASGNGTLGGRVLNDDGSVFFTFTDDTTRSVRTTGITKLTAGHITAAETATAVLMDDLALNDDQGTDQNSYPGPGKVVLLKPTSDNTVLNFSKPGGATTGLSTSVDNTPPVGIADSTLVADAEKQIRSATNATTPHFSANLGAYTTAVASGGGGMAATDLVRLVQALARGGRASTTSGNMGVSGVSNPALTEVTQASGTTAAGTDPTGWTSFRTAVAYNPSVTLGTSPVVDVRKATGTTTAGLFDLLGLYVEYTVSPVVPLDAASGVASATLDVTIPASAATVPLAAASGAASATLAATAPTYINTLGALGPDTIFWPDTTLTPDDYANVSSFGASYATLVVSVPTPIEVPLGAASGVASATLALTAQTTVALDAASATASATLAVTAKTTVALGASSAVASTTLALTAKTAVPLGASSVVASATLALTTQTAIPLGASSAVSSATLALTAQTYIPLGAASAVASGSAAVTSPGIAFLTLSSADGLASATLALTAKTTVPLGASSGVSSATLAVAVPTRIIPQASSAVSSATLALTAPAKLTLSASTATSSATLVVRTTAVVPLEAATALSSASLVVRTTAVVPLEAASATLNATLVLLDLSGAQLHLAPCFATADGTLVIGVGRWQWRAEDRWGEDSEVRWPEDPESGWDADADNRWPLTTEGSW